MPRFFYAALAPDCRIPRLAAAFAFPIAPLDFAAIRSMFDVFRRHKVCLMSLSAMLLYFRAMVFVALRGF